MSLSDMGHVVVLGAGKSGLASAAYCVSQAKGRVSSLTVFDSSLPDVVALRVRDLQTKGVIFHFGAEKMSGLCDLCIASPGIAPHTPLLSAAFDQCRDVISEVEFAYRESVHRTWVAVTGTNGKTTTTALITHLLSGTGAGARSVGNIGTPAIQAVGDGGEEVLVAEVSSFQLELTSSFRPAVAVMLNITPDHIDWHGSLEEYTAAKRRVFANLGPGSVAVIDVDDAGSASCVEDAQAAGAMVVRVSRTTPHPGGAFVSEGVLTLSTPDGRIDLVPVDALLIKGPHNASNALAAAAAAYHLGASPQDIRDRLRDFEPIEHRLEPAGLARDVEWFNDSKATNPDAVFKALDSFGERPLVLLLGGRNKGNDFRPLAIAAAAKAHGVVVFGEAGGEIAEAFEGLSVRVERVPGLADAVETAAAIARVGDAVVLSPACASFDEFSGYEERGRVFKELVASMAEGEGAEHGS